MTSSKLLKFNDAHLTKWISQMKYKKYVHKQKDRDLRVVAVLSNALVKAKTQLQMEREEKLRRKYKWQEYYKTEICCQKEDIKDVDVENLLNLDNFFNKIKTPVS